MKKVYFFLIALAISVGSYAASLNEQQQMLQNDIMVFLREEGFVPEIDVDGDISFKREGSRWYVVIDSRDVNPMYLKLMQQYAYGEKYTKEAVTALMPEVNAYKGIKLVAYDNYYSFSAELYVVNADPLRYAFYKLLSQITSAENALSEKIKDASSYSSSAITIESIDIANVEANNDIISDYGKIIYGYKTKYLKARISANVTTSGSYTLYTKFYNADGALTTFDSSPSGYSFSDEVKLGTGSQKIYLSGWGSTSAGHWKAGNYRIEVYLNNKMLYKKEFTIY